jgi:uncharacterized protein YeaO (DUF488 family)
MMRIGLKRAYATPGKDDGLRILVDRIWPRGISKDALKLDAWLREIAPSGELRKWFGHDPEKWAEFKRRYFIELDGKNELLSELMAKVRQGTVTLVYAAQDETHNNAVALKEYFETKLNH